MERKYFWNIDESGNLLPEEEFIEQIVDAVDDKEIMNITYMSDNGGKLVVIDLEDYD